MIKFFLFRQGLRTDVETRYDDFLHGDPNRIKAMVVISLLDIANLQITDNLLASMQLLRYAYQLEHATLLYNSANGTWKTIHTRWDEELLSVLYDKSKKEGFLDRIELLEQVKSLVYQVEEIVYAVIGAVYEIAAKGIIPIDNVTSIFQIDSLSNKEKIKDLYVRYIGYAYFQLERYNEAIEYYDKALKIDPQYASAYNDKGVVFSRLGRSAEALSFYSKALEINDNDPLTLNNKGKELEKLDRDNEALACYDKALEIDNTDSYVWYNIAMVLEKLGRYKEALACYKKTNETGLWNIHIGTKIEGLQSKLTEDDLKYRKKILEENNRNPKAWRDIGMSLHMQGQYGEALKCYDKALEIDNNDVKALHSNGVVLQKLQNENEALKCYDRALKIDDGSALLWYNKGILHHGLKDYNEALKCYNRSLELNQNMISALVNKALVLERLSRDNEALECYDKVLRLEPANGFAMDKKRLLSDK